MYIYNRFQIRRKLKVTTVMIMPLLRALIVLSLIGVCLCLTSSGYVCEDGSCVPGGFENHPLAFTNFTSPETLMSLQSCRLFCDKFIGIWPQPTGKVTIGKTLMRINPKTLTVNWSSFSEFTKKQALLREVVDNFLLKFKTNSSINARQGGVALCIKVDIGIQSLPLRFSLTEREDYRIRSYHVSREVVMVHVLANTFFGCRHALETLLQLVTYDNVQQGLFMPSNISIADAPAFPYRGIAIQSSGNSLNKNSITRIIDVMAVMKLNTLHWRIDHAETLPHIELVHTEILKAKSHNGPHAFTEDDIRDIVDYGLSRGVRILPEFNIGNHFTKLTHLMQQNRKSFKNKRPSSECLYEVLEIFFRNVLNDFPSDVFQLNDVFHEWTLRKNPNSEELNKYKNLKNKTNFMELWKTTINSSYERLLLANKFKTILAIIRNRGQNFTLLDPSKFIILWREDSNDAAIRQFLQNNRRVILENNPAFQYDYRLLKTYETSPLKILSEHGISYDKKHLILGSEMTILPEKLDIFQLWNILAVWSERMWSNPSTNWFAARNRMLLHRERFLPNIS